MWTDRGGNAAAHGAGGLFWAGPAASLRRRQAWARLASCGDAWSREQLLAREDSSGAATQIKANSRTIVGTQEGFLPEKERMPIRFPSTQGKNGRRPSPHPVFARCAWSRTVGAAPGRARTPRSEVTSRMIVSTQAQRPQGGPLDAHPVRCAVARLTVRTI